MARIGVGEINSKISYKTRLFTQSQYKFYDFFFFFDFFRFNVSERNPLLYSMESFFEFLNGHAETTERKKWRFMRGWPD